MRSGGNHLHGQAVERLEGDKAVVLGYVRVLAARFSGSYPVRSATAAWFGALSPRSEGARQLSPRAWTGIGLLAIPLWATWPALALRALSIPAFECLTVAFLFGWIVLTRLERVSRSECANDRGGDVRSITTRRSFSWVPAIACALGLTGSNAFHILATHHIPAAEANLISYLWPVEIIALGGALQLFRLQSRHIVGLCLGFAGTVMLLGGTTLSLSMIGVVLAFLSGISWALYCVFRLTWRGDTTLVLQRGCAISTVLCAALHFTMESTAIPDIGGLAASAAVGIVPLALGNLAWDEGFRRGDSRLLAVMAYATPLCSALLLVALGLEQPTRGLLVGATLIVTAGFLSHNRSSGH
jgi:drug/metabolite transporter (DMT)-like permease